MKLSTKPFCMGFPGAMKCQSIAASLHQASMALQVNSVPWSDTIIPGLRRRSTIAASSRATRRPEIDVSGMKSGLGKAIRYTLNHWDGLTRFIDDGRIEIDSNTVERKRLAATLLRLA
ncbi:hypothetical protein ACVWZL_000484 [Bradyrhizobium sp. GM2.4]